MEAMIAAKPWSKWSERELAVDESTSTSEDLGELAVLAWQAANVMVRDGNDVPSGAARGERTYLEGGAKVGRYVVLRALAAGGMGVVYAAYDPDLDRRVALKLVRPGMGDDEGRARLLREAQALAKLSHPNVVSIYDVGVSGEQVWLAMELVRGQTLREWLKERRPWREVLRVMRAAGRGLEAAHAAGLLHRDFKPDNVMVGKGDQVWVMDFGLARARPNVLSLEVEESAPVPMRGADTLALAVTEAGALVGTPRYMAPEQFMGQEPTAAVDQFALCVTLWEGLHGVRPFEGETLDELVENVVAGRVQEPPERRGVPSWLRKVCERGMSRKPQERFESMDALLEALAKGQRRARVRLGLAAGGMLALIAGGAEGYRRLETARVVAACEQTGAEVEEAWNVERRRALHEAMMGTGVSYAQTTVEKVMPWLDRQADEWREARVDACLDARVRKRWDAKTLERSLWCLDERRTELQSLVDELTLSDADVLHEAVMAAAGLASVSPCRHEATLDALASPPKEDREAIRAVRADLTRSGNLERAGRYGEGLALARQALERAEDLAWQPLSAAARLRVGSLLERTGAHAEAEAMLEEAYFAAAEGVASEVAVDAAEQLAFVVGMSSARHADGRRWGRHATVALAGVRDDESLERARLLSTLGTIHRLDGAYDQAKVLHERALAIQIEALGPGHPGVAIGLNNLAGTHWATGAYDEAKALYRRALEVFEDGLGSDHPDVAIALGNLAASHAVTGAYDEAKVLFERALAIRERALGPEHHDVAINLDNLANLYSITGAHDDARTFRERALTILERVLGPEHPDLARTLGNLANDYRATGAHEQAMVLDERALALLEAALGPTHPDLSVVLHNLATDRRLGGAFEEAKELDERAIAIIEESVGPEHPSVAYSLVGLAQVALEQRRPAEAMSLAQRAVTVREQGKTAAHELAGARFVLARALWDAPADEGRDRARAMALATQARDTYRAAGEPRARDLAEVEQWLGEVARPR